jgi:hypothetical protein
MINQSVCASFIKELFEGIHNFGTAPDVFMLALYTSAARLDGGTTVYSATNEVAGAHYDAGGEILSIRQRPTVVGTRVMVNFNDIFWPVGVSIIARGGLIYNSSKANRAVMVVDFGLDINSVSTGKFGVKFPPNTLDLNPAAMVAS